MRDDVLRIEMTGAWCVTVVWNILGTDGAAFA